MSTPTLSSTVIDGAVNLLEKVSSPASRAGNTVERVGKMLDEGVSPSVIALQMTENSPNGNQYSKSDVLAYGKVYEDAKTKGVVTAAQSRALIQDQQEQSSQDDGSLAPQL